MIARRRLPRGCLTAFLAAGGLSSCGEYHVPTPKPDAASPPPEICTDGVDNDGNGLVDCADPACQSGYTCVTTPAGWTIGAFLPGFSDQIQASCPLGYGPNPLFVLEPASTVTCSCECDWYCGRIDCMPYDNEPPLVLTAGGPDGGCSESDAGTLTVTNTGTATSSGCLPYQLGAGQSIGFTKPPFSSPSPSSTGTTLVGHQNAVLCTPAAIGGGCGTGRACVPKPSSNEWGICAYQARNIDGKPLSASVACPQDWVSSVANDGGTPLAVSVATNWDESGACTPCSCEPDPEAACADPTLTLYSDPNCQVSVTAVGPGECALASTTILSAQYNATPVHAGCTSSGSEPTGIEKSSPGAGYVVCCAQ